MSSGEGFTTTDALSGKGSAKGVGKASPPPPRAKGQPKGQSWREARQANKAEISAQSAGDGVSTAGSGKILTPAMLYDQKKAEATASSKDDGPANILKLICFDFDHTLAQIHLYETLAHHIGDSKDEQLLAAYKELYEVGDHDHQVFGSVDRLLALTEKLQMLAALGVQIFCVTKGSERVVEHALSRCCLLQYFAGITDANPKQQTVQILMNTRFEKRLRADQAVLVDDTARNFTDASTQEELRSLVNPEMFTFFEQAAGHSRDSWQQQFEVGAISTGGQGYCRVMLVDVATGITEEQLSSLVECSRR